MRILVFGDSITQGFNDDQSGGWTNRLAQYAIQKKVTSVDGYDVSVFNLGISGDTTDGLTKRLPVEIKARLEGREGAVVFALGINDSQYEVDTDITKVAVNKYVENIVECITEVKKYTDKIFINSLLPVDEVLLTPMPWKVTHGYKMEYVNLYDSAIRTIAKEQECTLIDMSDVLPDTSARYLYDGLHPNAEGHRLIFWRVKEVLENKGIL